MNYSTRLTHYINMYLRFLSEGNIKKTDLYRKRVELLLNNPPKQIKIKYTDGE